MLLDTDSIFFLTGSNLKHGFYHLKVGSFVGAKISIDPFYIVNTNSRMPLSNIIIFIRLIVF